ncbi:MAG: DNA repair protein RadC [Anaerolineales bacterium]|nr:DNA repair protein RadC [Anaerolineales bacterium]
MTQLSLLPYQGYESSPPARRPLRDQPAYRVMHDSGACSTTELVAVLIGGARPLEAAQNLLTRFGSLHDVARAAITELTQIAGIGTGAAARLKAALEISRRLLVPEGERRQIRSPADAAAILQPIMMSLDQEYLFLLMLDTRNRVLGEPVELYHGSLNTSLIRVGEVYRPAIRANAAAVIISHNHPSGDPAPSPEDVAVTRALVEAGKLLDIECIDHIICGAAARFVSMKERRLGFE